MRSLFLIFSSSLLLLSHVHAAPTVEEQANYDAACLEAVNAVNAYRAANSMPALAALKEMCQAAREQAEFEELGVGVSANILQRSRDAGYAGEILSGPTAIMSRGQGSATALFQNSLSFPGNPAIFLSSEADYIGVGMAVVMRGVTTEYRLRIFLGKEFPAGAEDGTPGMETATGRGLLALSLLREIRAGAWSGDSINGFIRDPGVIVLTVNEEKAFNAALAAFARKTSAIKLSAGRGVKLKLPPQLVALLERVILKGRLPAGIRFDSRTNGFKGSAKRPGTYTVTLSADLKGPVKGSETLKPIKIRFTVSG